MNARIIAEIRALQRLGTRMASAETLSEVLQAAADAVADTLPADRVTLIEVDQDRRTVGYFARGGPGRDRVIRVGFDELQGGLTGWVLREGVPALSPKDEPDPRESAGSWARRKATDCGSILVVPLKFDDRILGTVTAINRLDQGNFNAEHAELLGMFADCCAIIIENTRLFLEAKKVSQSLLDQNALKDKLFTILAHDLRGPIGNTCVLLGLISNRLKDSPELSAIVEEGTRSAYQTYNLTENLLGWVRSQMGEIGALKTRVPLVTSLVNVQAWLAPQAQAKGLFLEVDCPGFLTAFTEEGTLQTIVRNLVSNAIKYSPDGSVVHLRARARDNGIRIEVEDHGQGIPPSQKDTLFGAHQVESREGTRGERGNGLGLMFCADLARSLGGVLEVESVVGQGSTFRLTLPDEVDGEL